MKTDHFKDGSLKVDVIFFNMEEFTTNHFWTEAS